MRLDCAWLPTTSHLSAKHNQCQTVCLCCSSWLELFSPWHGRRRTVLHSLHTCLSCIKACSGLWAHLLNNTLPPACQQWVDHYRVALIVGWANRMHVPIVTSYEDPHIFNYTFRNVQTIPQLTEKVLYLWSVFHYFSTADAHMHTLHTHMHMLHTHTCTHTTHTCYTHMHTHAHAHTHTHAHATHTHAHATRTHIHNR